MEELSRRNFLKGAGVVGAATIAGIGIAGCNSDSSGTSSGTSESTASATTSEKTEGVGTIVDADRTEDVDVVVVGSGIGGFYASMITKEQMPEANVVMLEKNSNLGGSTNLAECNGPATNAEEIEARLSGYNSAKNTEFISNSMLHYERVKERGDNADWLFAKHGVGWYFAGTVFYEGGNGTSAIHTLTPIAEEEGVDIRTSSRATALLLDDEYTVTGIQYTDDASGEIVHLNAKSVILATGGMSTNKELLSQYSSQDMDKIVGWGEGQDGDGHLMVEQTAHGRANHLCVASLFNNVGSGDISAAYDSPLGVALSMQYSNMYVNEYGIRFADESGGGSLGTSESGKLVESQGYVFSVADTSMIEKYEAGGCERHYSGFADECVGNEIEVMREIETYADSDFVFQGDTIDALGQAIAQQVPHFDVDAFVAEVERYNSFADNQEDADYGKDASYLWKIDSAPYYAFQLCSGMLNTNGGIRINRNAQVVDARGKVIEGLYAAGVCTSGWDGEVYGGGTCQTVGMWAGSKAARHTVEHILGGTVDEDWMGTERSEDPSSSQGGPGGGAPEGDGDGPPA